MYQLGQVFACQKVINALPQINSHAEGDTTYASGNSHAEGYNTYASSASHAEGSSIVIQGSGSHVQGFHCTGTSQYSFVSGYNLVTNNSDNMMGMIFFWSIWSRRHWFWCDWWSITEIQSSRRDMKYSSNGA